MNRTADNLLAHELIGLELEVLESYDPTTRGLRGIVIHETRNMLKLQTQKGEKVVQKRGTLFSFLLATGEFVRLDGSLLCRRPEDRVTTLR